MAQHPHTGGSPSSVSDSSSTLLSAHVPARRTRSLGDSFIMQAHPANLPLHQPTKWMPVDSEEQPQGQEGQVEDICDHRKLSLLSECGQLLSIACPLVVEGVAAICEQLVASSCVGHLSDPAALPALLLAQAIYNVSGYSIVSGLASALETLCGQAFGAGNYRMLPAMLVQAQLVCLLSVVPTAVIWGSGVLAQLLPWMGQDSAIAAPTSRLLQIMVPSLLLSVISDSVCQYLLAQGEALPGMVGSLVCLSLSPLYNYGLVFGLWGLQGLGVIGAGLAAVAVQGTLVAILLTYMLYRDCWRGTGHWEDFRLSRALQGWGSYLSYGVPCVLMVCLEWWVWEVLVLLAGLLPDAETAVAVMGLSTQLSLLPWMLTYSLGTATATRAAQALGAGNSRRAHRVLRIACFLVLLSSVLMCGGIWLFRRPLIGLLTEHHRIQQELEYVLPVVVAAVVCDGLVAVLMGLLRASGRQGIGAFINCGSYWVLGLPVSWLLGFKAGQGVLGLRLGLAVASASQALVLVLLLTFWFDWDQEVLRAKDLVGVADDGVSPEDDAGPGAIVIAGDDVQGGPVDATAPLLQHSHQG